MENGEFVKLCADSGDVVAWQEFVRRFHRPIAQAVLRELRRYGRSATEAADDLIQETYLKLCADNLRIIRDFEHKQPDSFISFLRVVASNIVRDHFKAYYSQKRKGNLVDQLVDESVAVINDEGYGTPRSIEREVLIAEIRRYLEDCVPKTRHEQSIRIFWLHYRAGMSPSAIASLPETWLRKEGIESLITRISRCLRSRLVPDILLDNQENLTKRDGKRPPVSFSEGSD